MILAADFPVKAEQNVSWLAKRPEAAESLFRFFRVSATYKVSAIPARCRAERQTTQCLIAREDGIVGLSDVLNVGNFLQ